MLFNTFLYTSWQGIKNIWRNKIFSIASIATMSACIFLFGLFYSIVVNFQSIVKDAESGMTVTMFFLEETSEEQMEEIGKAIDKRVEVSKKRFVSAEEAWQEYQEKYMSGFTEALDDDEVMKKLAEDNPLSNSAHYEIFLNDVSMQQSLVTYLESLEGVREVKSSDTAANTLSDFNRLLGYVSVGVIIILICVAIFLISNTVMTGISVRKEEIAIMKLIGSTDYFVRAPFMVEGILIGLIGSAIPLILLYVLYNKIIVYVGEKFIWLNNIMNFLPINQVFSTLIPAGLILGVGIGFLGSFVTIRKHLHV